MDLLCSLEESVKGDWNGDVDDGKLQLLRAEYLARIDDVPKLNKSLSCAHMEKLISDVESDVHQCKGVTL